MTSRSIVFSTAALLLLSAAAPVQFGFSPTAAVAQEVSAEVRAALTGDPAGIEAAQLSDRIRVLRDAIESGALKGPDRKAAQQKVKAYREVLKQLREERKDARQERQADEPEAGQRTQTQRGDQQAEQQAGEAERQAEQQQRREQRQAEQQEQAQEQAQRPAQRQAQTGDSGLSEEMRAALRDTRPASELEPAELRDRVQTLRGMLQSAPLTQEQRSEVQARMQADREVLRSRRDQRQQQAEPEQAEPEQGQTEQAQTRERQPRQSRAEAMPEAEVEERAQEIMSDNRPADDLDDEALRQRLSDNRAILETGKLSREEVRELRQQLRADREELRGRVAAKQDAAEEEDDEPASGATSSSTSTSSTEVTTTTNVNVIIEQQTPADRLSERQLERRVRALNRALKEERLARRDAEIAREIVERDRRELRERLHAERDRRRDRWRDPRYRDELFIDFNVGYRPPPVIFAAEAMPRDIEVQLLAPPPRQVTRAYSMQEIASNQDVREMMPGIEIDTLNFDFGSAEVRPEEIDKLDAIAEVIERIVAARPDEVFLIEGHTDAVGSDAANHALSQRRSQAVAEALLDYYAIDPENLQTVGLGEQYLKIWTEEPEEENRRVTIRRITPLLAGGQG